MVTSIRNGFISGSFQGNFLLLGWFAVLFFPVTVKSGQPIPRQGMDGYLEIDLLNCGGPVSQRAQAERTVY